MAEPTDSPIRDRLAWEWRTLKRSWADTWTLPRRVGLGWDLGFLAVVAAVSFGRRFPDMSLVDALWIPLEAILAAMIVLGAYGAWNYIWTPFRQDREHRQELHNLQAELEGQWVRFSARRVVLNRANDKGFNFMLVRIPRATFSNLTREAVELEIYATWGLSPDESERGQAINEASKKVVQVAARSASQVENLGYCLPESKWEGLAGSEGGPEGLFAYLVVKDHLTNHVETWELGSATRDGSRSFPLTPLTLAIISGYSYIKATSHGKYEYAVIVENCVLTNQTDKPMNLEGWLLVSYEGGINGQNKTELLSGILDTPQTPFTVEPHESWSGNLAFGFEPEIAMADRLKTIGENHIRAEMEFRDYQTPGWRATRGLGLKLPSEVRPSESDT